MTITWYGYSCFRIDTREAVLAIDPFTKGIGFTPPRFHADVVLVTHAHPDHSNIGAIPGSPAIVSGPGEYEIRGVAIQGIPTFHDGHRGSRRGPNTIYRITAEGMAVAHLGDFGEGDMREETVEALGNVDVLLIPVGGSHTIGADAAALVVKQIEPKLVIPMHYRIPGLTVKLSGVEDFLKSYGAAAAERPAKLTVRKRDLPEAETRLVVLSKS